MKILLTGGLGFIGTALLPHLSDSEVVVVDNLHPQVHLGDASIVKRLPAHARFVMGDVAAPQTWRLFDSFRPDIVIHLAAETGTGQSLLESRRHAHVNVAGTATLLDGLSGRGIVPSTIMLTSSRAVYGEGVWLDASGRRFAAIARASRDLARGEFRPKSLEGERGVTPCPQDARTVEPRPTNVYAATKLAQEHILRAWTSSFGVKSAIVRLQNVYGAGQAVGNPYTGVLTYLAKRALNGQPLEIFENGGIVRDFVHVDDVARAITSALNAPTLPEVLDIGSGTPMPLEDVAKLLVTLSGAKTEVRLTNEYRAGDVRAAFADISSAEQFIGYRPIIDLPNGLGGLLEWVDQ